ncbi:MAG TPA: hypothetical protein VEK73_20925 [Xanthobacteraceae bacterium]|nr:hypothetical protein [Xanthobacteraceae bacterium]
MTTHSCVPATPASPTCDAQTAPSIPARLRAFGRAFLDALHQSRRGQAARAIREYRHLIDDAKAGELWRAIERSHAQASRSKASAPARASWIVQAAPARARGRG